MVPLDIIFSVTNILIKKGLILVENFFNYEECQHSIDITLFSQVIKLGGTGNMSCKVLELYLMDACLSRFFKIDCESFR